MELFYLKKWIGALLMPMSISFILILFGMILRQRALGKLSIAVGTLLIIVSSFPFVPNTLLGKLEHAYPQFDLSDEVEYIVVLGCGHVNDATLPKSAQLKHCTDNRLIEAVRIHKKNPGAVVITSGVNNTEAFTQAEFNKEILAILGISFNKLKAMNVGRDTHEEATYLKSILHNKRFALVTSASHMKRAVIEFENVGLVPYPAPTEHLVKRSDNPSLRNYLPHSSNIQKMERWWYETLGLLWQKLRPE
ncbi:YdcF family protein [Aestuariibacter sp. AA17]|uniref:YdcF family protein n=1 Tax=Fluctibacter corallii TaxID=2984329 RepID=A0ABT3A9T0_9ALTE|nr:ElyC/SanA/YdcF family protein [Aestuariibacter sp. AA17]MCV2885354.1 YdcF family protein [Aestuariibacter sp. AA17]